MKSLHEYLLESITEIKTNGKILKRIDDLIFRGTCNSQINLEIPDKRFKDKYKLVSSEPEYGQNADEPFKSGTNYYERNPQIWFAIEKEVPGAKMTNPLGAGSKLNSSELKELQKLLLLCTSEKTVYIKDANRVGKLFNIKDIEVQDDVMTIFLKPHRF